MGGELLSRKGKWRRQPTDSGRGHGATSANELSQILCTHTKYVFPGGNRRTYKSLALRNRKLSIDG